MKKKIGILVGSLRENSVNKIIALEIEKLLTDSFNIKFINISALKFYNQDLEDSGKTPASWLTFKKQANDCDAVIFVSPEYNRSYAPLIKNAIDIGSRPYEKNLWANKPGAVITVSPGGMGGFGANYHLKQVLSFLGVAIMPQPEGCISNVNEYLNEEGKPNESLIKYLSNIAESFINWLENFD